MAYGSKMQRRRGIAFLVLIVVASLGAALVSCGGKGEATKNPVQAEAQKLVAEKAKDAAAKAEEKIDQAIQKTTDVKVDDVLSKPEPTSPTESYSYDPINKVDPFSPSISDFELPEVGGSDANILTQFEIRYFKLVGVVADEAQPRAIFEDPAGKSYVVGVGTPIGRNLGVIDAITKDSVIVTEKRIIPGTDELETVPLNIKLHPEREQGTPGAPTK